MVIAVEHEHEHDHNDDDFRSWRNGLGQLFCDFNGREDYYNIGFNLLVLVVHGPGKTKMVSDNLVYIDVHHCIIV